MKTSERIYLEDQASASRLERTLDRVIPKGDLPDESRVFYRWLEEQWHSSGQQTVEPRGFMIDELSDRGSRIQKLASEIHELRERLMEREAQLARVHGELSNREKELASLKREYQHLEMRYRAGFQGSSGPRRSDVEAELARLREENERSREAIAMLNRHLEELLVEVARREHEPEPEPPKPQSGYRQVRVADLEQILDEIHQAVERAHAAEAERTQVVEHYREVFAQKDNRQRELELQVSNQQRRITDLEKRLSTWPVAHAIRLDSMLRRR